EVGVELQDLSPNRAVRFQKEGLVRIEEEDRGTLKIEATQVGVGGAAPALHPEDREIVPFLGDGKVLQVPRGADRERGRAETGIVEPQRKGRIRSGVLLHRGPPTSPMPPRGRRCPPLSRRSPWPRWSSP